VTLAEAPQLDILHVPGGPGQQALMEDKWDKEFVSHHAHQLTL
jgi:cyclohexyl-isocyanide hydratase